MENNKFNKFYSKKSVSDLIVKLRTHRIRPHLDKEWFEGLKKHLSERDITDEERKIVEHILSLNSEEIEQEEEKRLRDVAINSSNISIRKSGINAAGKSLKHIVYAAVLLILFTTFGIIISVTSKDPEKIQLTYLFLGIISLVCNISILISLYLAGDHLENS